MAKATKKKAVKKDPMAAVLANIEKGMGNKTGRPVFSRFKDVEIEECPVIPYGIQAINDASNIGGAPCKRIVEIYGPESGGKSLISLYVIAAAQKMGLEAALIDVEGAFDPNWAKQHGVDVDNLVWGNDFKSGEQALEYACRYAESGAFGVIVIDSTTALMPKGELESTLEDNARVGAQAALLSRGVRKMNNAVIKGNCLVIFINQIREKIGVMYGNPETTPGGRALKFYSAQRLRVSTKQKIKVKEGGEDKIVGQLSKVTFIKNKTAIPFGSCEFKIVFDPMSLNPVVMMANAARDCGLIRPYKGIMRIQPNVFDNDKSIETGTTGAVELANYFIKEGMVLDFLDRIVEEIEGDPTADILDEAILEMKEDHSKIVSPTGDVIFEVNKVADVDPSEISNEELTEVSEDELKEDLND